LSVSPSPLTSSVLTSLPETTLRPGSAPGDSCLARAQSSFLVYYSTGIDIRTLQASAATSQHILVRPFALATALHNGHVELIFSFTRRSQHDRPRAPKTPHSILTWPLVVPEAAARWRYVAALLSLSAAYGAEQVHAQGLKRAHRRCCGGQWACQATLQVRKYSRLNAFSGMELGLSVNTQEHLSETPRAVRISSLSADSRKGLFFA
jgi:hypothetical protein